MKLKREFMDEAWKQRGGVNGQQWRADAPVDPPRMLPASTRAPEASRPGPLLRVACRMRETKLRTRATAGLDRYSQTAMRAVNQALGRVIRHRDDFGAVLLLDSRFGDPGTMANISSWLRPCMKVATGFGQVSDRRARLSASLLRRRPSPRVAPADAEASVALARAASRASSASTG